MDELEDDRIQRLLEAGQADETTGANAVEQRTIETYALLFKALKQEPTSALPPQFSAKVVARLRLEEQWSADRTFYTWVGLGFLSSLLLCIGVPTILSGQEATEALSTLGTYKWLIIFSVLSFALFQFGEQKLLSVHLSPR